MLESSIVNTEPSRQESTKYLGLAKIASLSGVELLAERYFLQFIQAHTFNKNVSVYENAEIIFRALTVSGSEEIQLQSTFLFQLATKYELLDGQQILDTDKVQFFCDGKLFDNYQEDLLICLLEMLQNQIVCKLAVPTTETLVQPKTNLLDKLKFWRKEN